MKYKVALRYMIEAETAEEAKATYDKQGTFQWLSVSEAKPEPGTELKKLISKFGFKPRAGCKCNQHIMDMNRRGVEWCEQNVDTIVGWLRDEAERSNIPFTKIGARILVKKAIRNVKKNKQQS